MELNSKRKKTLSYTMILIALGFIVLTVFVLLVPTTVFDIKFSKEVQEHQNPVLNSCMEALSWFGNMPVTPVMVVATALLFLLFKYKREALFILLTILSGLVSTIIKLLVNRPRPGADIVRIIGKTSQQSFPSGHMLFYVVFLGFLILLMLRLSTLQKVLRITVSITCLILILGVAVSRIYLGAHWFTDVAGGFLLGMICLYLISYFYLKNSKLAV